ncbi:hypothetical protein [Bacillus sp. JCM 19034]|uniref:hypothetical protein n=1 Tax=Bacillus sp. JCM 19034 TaxID=1481928 RepID=UPI000ADA85A9|nr:hypothetical protein [Bacillus sp. JCM 19034]
MVKRNDICRACEGTGMLMDDEEWQYTCTVCRGEGHINPENHSPPALLNVDENNRILD